MFNINKSFIGKAVEDKKYLDCIGDVIDGKSDGMMFEKVCIINTELLDHLLACYDEFQKRKV